MNGDSPFHHLLQSRPVRAAMPPPVSPSRRPALREMALDPPRLSLEEDAHLGGPIADEDVASDAVLDDDAFQPTMRVRDQRI
jgi:hypothetical protein